MAEHGALETYSRNSNEVGVRDPSLGTTRLRWPNVSMAPMRVPKSSPDWIVTPCLAP